jgi:hypothetical protein
VPEGASWAGRIAAAALISRTIFLPGAMPVRTRDLFQALVETGIPAAPSSGAGCARIAMQLDGKPPPGW